MAGAASSASALAPMPRRWPCNRAGRVGRCLDYQPATPLPAANPFGRKRKKADTAQFIHVLLPSARAGPDLFVGWVAMSERSSQNAP